MRFVALACKLSFTFVSCLSKFVNSLYDLLAAVCVVGTQRSYVRSLLQQELFLEGIQLGSFRMEIC
jgi:hypothetical protein